MATQAERINEARAFLAGNTALSLPPVPEVPDVPAPAAEPQRPAAGGLHRGPWQPKTAYGRYDLVTRNGQFYSVDVAGVSPATWELALPGLTEVKPVGVF